MKLTAIYNGLKQTISVSGELEPLHTESEDIIHNVTPPPKSLLYVQNDQYVESEQVIAEVCTEKYARSSK